MQTVGHFCVALACLIYLIPWQLLQASRARGGHADVGVLIGSLVLGLPLGLLLAGAFAAAAALGSFDWLPMARGAQYALVLFTGLLSALLGVAASALRLEPVTQRPWVLRPFVPWLAQWLPPLQIISALMLLDADGASLAGRAARLMWQLPAGLSLLVALGAFVEWMHTRGERQRARLQEDMAFHQRRDRQMLAEVQRMDPQRDVAGLLNFSNVYEADEIRTLALSRLAQHPDLDAAIVRELAEGSAYEAIIYLQGNDPPHPQRVAAAIAIGIERIAARLHESIQGTHTLHADQGEPEVLRILDVVRRFQRHGVDYAPALASLRRALQHGRAGQVELRAARRL